MRYNKSSRIDNITGYETAVNDDPEPRIQLITSSAFEVSKVMRILKRVA